MATEYFRSSLFAQEMEDTWTGTVRFNAEQGLSESQKAQARENIGAVPFGSNLKILGHFDTVAALQASAPQNVGDAYSVGAAAPYNLYIFDGLRNEWLNYGQIRAADISAQYVENQVIAVSAWTQDNASLAGYSYKAQITVSGATGEDFPIVAFNQSDAVSGNFAPLSFSFDGYLEIWAKEKPTAAVTIPIATIIVNGGNGRGITNATGGITAGSIGTANLADGSVTAVKIADECKNIIRENVALAASAFTADSTVDGASYKAELTVTGCTSAMLPLIAWTAAQSEELEVKRIESAAGKVIIYSANAPSADLTIPTVALISPIGTGSSGASGGSGGGITGTNGVTFTPHLSADGTLSWTNDGGLTNPVPVNIKGEKGDTGAQGAKGDKGDTGAAGSDASVTAANIKTALGYTPADSANIPTVPTAAINANTAARHSHSNKDVLEEITGVVTADKINDPDHVTDLVQYDAFQLAAQSIIDKIPSVPAALKNPYSLTVKVNGNSVDYDGSAAKTVEITTQSGGDDTPDYVLTAADALAKKVVGHVSSDNIVFAVMADAHLGYYTDTANMAGKQAGQALKRLNERSALDFVAHVGDYSTGAWNTTAADAQEDNADYQLLIGSKYPGRAIWCPGNHDDAPYQATANRLTQTQMYAAIGRKNLVSGGYVPNNACYGYMDFPGLHLRVIYLDTHDHRSWGTIQIGSGVDNPYLNADNISAAQLQYLVDHALNFSGVSDPSQWSILVFSHAALNGSGSYTDPVSGTVHPSNTANAATLLKAYATKQSGSITHGDGTVNYDFSAITPAQIIACIHGHEHRYANETVGGAFLSICCPNIMNGRERASADGNTYTKTAGTANGTSFCVFSINRTDKKIYVDHYGPGIDREFTYTVPDPNAPSYTNQLPLATDTDGSVYNGAGWAAGYRLNSSGVPDGYSGSYLTGFIPAKLGDTVHLKNVTWQNGVSSGLNSGNQRISFYGVNKNHLAQTNAIGLGGTLSGVKDANGIWTQFTLKNFSGGNLANAAFFRLNCAGITSESIITVNEEIAEA